MTSENYHLPVVKDYAIVDEPLDLPPCWALALACLRATRALYTATTQGVQLPSGP